MAPPEILMSYLRDAGIGQAVKLTDFHFDLTRLWRCGVQRRIAFTYRGDVAYHLGLRTHDDLVGGAMRNFQTHYRHPTWGWVEELQGVRPEQNPKARKESFNLKMVWCYTDPAGCKPGHSEAVR
ncbi:hypothetical protein PIB30_032635 [Stylosanthes scabra]|uniref:Uncharacterized protein n=1 Tax=Stylosanthes scabra TaxID=79078 RepID=A0ABU6VCZ9_9FABA|nr:hypothetical protein [Stylosanthes scabra]